MGCSLAKSCFAQRSSNSHMHNSSIGTATDVQSRWFNRVLRLARAAVSAVGQFERYRWGNQRASSAAPKG